MKLFFSILVTIFCLVLALAPELIMWWAWSAVAPENPAQKMLMICILGIFGTGVSIAFGLLALFLWAQILGAILD